MQVNIHAKVALPLGASSGSNATSHSYTLNTNDKQRSIYAALSSLERIPDLSQPSKIPQYKEISLEKALYPIVDAHDVLAVAGAFFGDEGKGKTVDAIAKHPKVGIIARTNSGENAGHTVFDEQGNKYVFHLCPSGILIEGKKNMIGPECVMDPISFMQKEVGQLLAKNHSVKDKLFIGNVHIVAPYHKLLDMICSPINSSTLKGMSYIHSSKVRKTGLRLDHIFNDEAIMRRRLIRDLDSYYGALKTRSLSNDDVLKMCELSNADGVQRIPPYVFDFVLAEDKVEYLVKLYQREVRDNVNFPPRCDVPHEIRESLARGEKLLLEGPQSYWLSNAREKFWESSTSADTSAAGLLATAQYNFQKYKTVVINVHKAPGSSRVGIGANPAAFVPQDYFSAQHIQTLRDLPNGMCEDFDAIQRAYAKSIRENGIVEPTEFTDKTGTYNIGVAMSVACSRHHGESGATTQKPRVCGTFDAVAHYEVNAVQGPYLSISALDRGDDYDELGITIAYVYHHPENKQFTCNGRVYKNGMIVRAGDPYPGESVLHFMYPIVKKIQGWRDSPIFAKKRAPNTPLPKGVCEFIATVEHFTGCQVLSIGNGPVGSNIIYLSKE
jgi:adenylosuccinate synthase